MPDLLTILIILAIVSLALGIIKKLFHVAIIAAVVLVIAGLLNGVLNLPL